MTQIQLRSTIDVSLISHVGSDASFAAAARVSTQGEASLATFNDSPEQLEGLIRYLLRERHGSPFEHAQLTFLVRAPIFVFREWHRHRAGWSYNETSGRYRELEPVFYIPPRERNLVQTGKPGQYVFVPGTDEQYEAMVNDDTEVCELAYAAYQRKLDRGIAREVARNCLPLTTYSSMYATCNPRSLMHFLSLRTQHEDAKFPSYPLEEIARAAEQMETSLADLFPLTHKAFVDYGRVAP